MLRRSKAMNELRTSQHVSSPLHTWPAHRAPHIFHLRVGMRRALVRPQAKYRAAVVAALRRVAVVLSSSYVQLIVVSVGATVAAAWAACSPRSRAQPHRAHLDCRLTFLCPSGELLVVGHSSTLARAPFRLLPSCWRACLCLQRPAVPAGRLCLAAALCCSLLLCLLRCSAGQQQAHAMAAARPAQPAPGRQQQQQAGSQGRFTARPRSRSST
jgi:hypothetical protein